MRIPANKSVAQQIAHLLYREGPMDRESIYTWLEPKHSREVISTAICRMRNDDQIEDANQFIRLTQAMAHYYDGLHKVVKIDTRPVVQPQYHNVWTKPMKDYEATMRRNVRPS